MKLIEGRKIDDRYIIEYQEERVCGEGLIWATHKFVYNISSLKRELKIFQNDNPRTKFRIIREKQFIVKFPPTKEIENDA